MNRYLFSWIKYTIGFTFIFLLAGFFLKVVVEGMQPDEVLALAMEVGWYQSLLFAMAAAAFLSYEKPGAGG